MPQHGQGGGSACRLTAGCIEGDCRHRAYARRDLFDRMPQGVEPTSYGRALIKWAGAVFDDVRQGVEEIGFLADPAPANCAFAE